MRLSYDPRTATEHRVRWSRAVAKVWELDEMVVDPPSTHPEHVFDYHDGLRIIASKERYGLGVFLHVSASVQPGSDLYLKVETKKISIEGFCQIVVDRVKAISSSTVVTLGFFSEGKGVPHFYSPALPKEIQE